MSSHQTVPRFAELTVVKCVRNPRPTIFDIGANRGQSYSRFRELFPEAQIWSFEPDPDMYVLLQGLIAGDPRACAVASAVGSKDGTTTLYRNNRSGTNSLAPIRDDSVWAREIGAGQRDTITARLVTLDSHCAREQIKYIDFAKFDIQGFEPDALKGAQGLLEARRIGLLQLELIPAAFYDRITTFSDVERWLLPHGYRLMTINRIVTDDSGLMRACDVLYGLQRSELN
ncbi:MAG TPA: FkbM family methyltransferase [Gammaproteobacteria bacterium]